MAKMTKIRKQRFTMLSNTVIEDERLTWKARGVFQYLYSKSEDWQFYETEVAKHSERDGRDSLRSGLEELERYGYLRRKRSRNKQGQVTTSDWFISDEPMLDFPTQAEPTQGEPTQANPTLPITDLTNTNKPNTNNTKDDDEQVINTNVKKAFNENKLQNQNEYSAVVTKRLLPLVKNVDSVKELNAMFDDALRDAIDKSNSGKVQKPVSYAITIVSNAVDWGAKNYDQFMKFTKSEQQLLNQDSVPQIVTDIDIHSLDLTQLKKEEQNNE